ncbi:MAG: DAK2 domain-containing protein [Tissierellia bacterium]|jgi:DAK2 domain fusion protein YloV|nr:DAK2 domain-containing protein [Tissierellia bacterium]
MMKMMHLDDKTLRSALRSGYYKLSADKEMINSLNVFPVPDGDTGTNMSLTLKTAIEMVEKDESSKTGEILRSFSKGSLMGARGNSGVILSQIFGGLARGAENSNSLSVGEFIKALEKSVEVAYKAVMKPVEGTILTVIRQSTQWVKEVEGVELLDFEAFFSLLLEKAHLSLKGTPELLPILKQSGVVDAGGQGLCSIFEGFLSALKGEEIILKEEEGSEHVHFLQEPTDIHFTYCTEFILRADKNSNEELKEKILEMGDSVVFVQDEDIVKVHLHTNNPGVALETALKYGNLLNIKIDNMKVQHETIMGVHHDNRDKLIIEEEIEIKNVAVIAVAAGEGFKNIFTDLGVSAVIQGGQTMNPSTEDILEEVEKIKANHIVILPNNSNIILAAEQAKAMSDKDIYVVETKTVPQGISAMMGYDPFGNIEDNIESMKEGLDVSTIQITYSVRNTKIQGFVIKEKDILCIKDGEIVAVEKTPEKALRKMLDLYGSTYDLITVYVGEDTDLGKSQKIIDENHKKNPDVEIELYRGDQPVYYYIMSLE